LRIEPVSICRANRRTLARSIQRSIRLLGDPDEILPKTGDVVLIKPNLGWDKDWRTGTTTSPHFVQAMIDLLGPRRPSKIIVGESPSIGIRAKDVFHSTGYDQLRGKGLEIRDLGVDELSEVRLPRGTLLRKVLLPASYLAADYFINAPVVKTHVNTCVTLSTKNLKGLLPSSEKKRFHLLGLDRCIAELSSIIEHDLILVDGQIGQEGMGPISGSPVKLGVVIAGFNPLAVDATCIRVMKIPFTRVKHLRIARKLGLGPASKGIRLAGDPLPSVSRRFQTPPRDFSKAYEGIRIVAGDPCSGCIGSLTVSLERMLNAGELEILKSKIGCVNIAIGPRARVPEEPEGPWVIVGRCLWQLKSRGLFIPGCSPQGWFVRDVLRSMIGLEPLFVDKSLLMGCAESSATRTGNDPFHTGTVGSRSRE